MASQLCSQIASALSSSGSALPDSPALPWPCTAMPGCSGSPRVGWLSPSSCSRSPAPSRTAAAPCPDSPALPGLVQRCQVVQARCCVWMALAQLLLADRQRPLISGSASARFSRPPMASYSDARLFRLVAVLDGFAQLLLADRQRPLDSGSALGSPVRSNMVQASEPIAYRCLLFGPIDAVLQQPVAGGSKDLRCSRCSCSPTIHEALSSPSRAHPTKPGHGHCGVVVALLLSGSAPLAELVHLQRAIDAVSDDEPDLLEPTCRIDEAIGVTKAAAPGKAIADDLVVGIKAVKKLVGTPAGSAPRAWTAAPPPLPLRPLDPPRNAL